MQADDVCARRSRRGTAALRLRQVRRRSATRPRRAEMDGKSAAAAGQVANKETGPGNRIAAEADLALKLSKCFRGSTRSPGLRSIERMPAGRSRSRRRNCSRKDSGRSPECLGVRGSATVTAPKRAARYRPNSTPTLAVRFEPSQLRAERMELRIPGPANQVEGALLTPASGEEPDALSRYCAASEMLRRNA